MSTSSHRVKSSYSVRPNRKDQSRAIKSKSTPRKHKQWLIAFNKLRESLKQGLDFRENKKSDIDSLNTYIKRLLSEVFLYRCFLLLEFKNSNY